MSMFQPATKQLVKARIGIDGPSGSGKTYTSLLVARGLAGDDGRIALVDTENDSARWYADVTPFHHAALRAPYTAARYEEAVHQAAEDKFDVLIIDSLSHAWRGKGGTLEQVDTAGTANKYAAWNGPSQEWQSLLDTIVAAPLHIVTTMRSRTQYEMVQRGSKQVPQKIGMAPDVRDGTDYEFGVMLSMDMAHHGEVTKTRIPALSGRTIEQPGVELGREIIEWTRADATDFAAPTSEVTIAASVGADMRRQILDALETAHSVGAALAKSDTEIREWAFKNPDNAGKALAQLQLLTDQAMGEDGSEGAAA